MAEITLCVVSGLVPFGIGAYINTKTNMERVPLNPVLVAAERAIAYPLALPISYGTRNVAWSTNFLWTVAILAPVSLTCWQWYLLAKTGSTIPKRWFGVKVVTQKNEPPSVSEQFWCEKEVVGLCRCLSLICCGATLFCFPISVFLRYWHC